MDEESALTQFVSKDEFGEMGEVFNELADKSRGITRLPKRAFDRQRVLQSLDEAFELIGGVPRMAIWAHHNPTEFYKLWGKTIPQSNMLDVMGKIEHHILPALPSSPLDDLPPIEGIARER
jgi:hypothetical protein